LQKYFNMSKAIDPIGKLMGLRYKSHPWHGIDPGPDSPETLTCFIEVVPYDTVKYEVDKTSGYLKIDRPQKYSNIIPALYGFIPQTLCDKKLAEIANTALGRTDIVGDNDPIDICVLTEKDVTHGNLLVKARPIGGFRMIDRNEADDKIIAVLIEDAVYGDYHDISDCPEAVINRLKHYFLSYKDMPGEKRGCEIPQIYGKEEAHRVIKASMEDYKHYVEKLMFS
jgi:inorganic pyrophosphatase